jgi:hypothetical protein
MAIHSRSKASSRKTQEPKKSTKSGSCRNPVPRLPAPRPRGREVLQSRADRKRSPFVESEEARLFSQSHAGILGVYAYDGICRGIVDPEILRIGCGLGQEELITGLTGVLPDFVASMNPRDALEKLALEQLMLHHARILALCRQASTNSNLDVVKVLNEACDAASNSFRRLMSAFRDHRQPPPSNTTIIAQANLSREQVVQNIVKQEAVQEKNADEQNRIVSQGSSVSATALPANAEGIALPPGCDLPNKTMAPSHGPADQSREGPSCEERAEAWRAVGRGDSPAEAGPPDRCSSANRR